MWHHISWHAFKIVQICDFHNISFHYNSLDGCYVCPLSTTCKQHGQQSAVQLQWHHTFSCSSCTNTVHVSIHTRRELKIYENVLWIYYIYLLVLQCVRLLKEQRGSCQLDLWQSSAGCLWFPQHYCFGNKPEIWGSVLQVAKQHNKGVVTRREEFPRDKAVFLQIFPYQTTRKLFFKENKEKCHLFGYLKVFRHICLLSKYYVRTKINHTQSWLPKEVSKRERGHKVFTENTFIFSTFTALVHIIKLRNDGH